MRSKTLISTIALAGVLATSLSTSAYADGGRHRGGHGGNGVAIAAGVLGALAIGSVIANAAAAPVYSAPPAYYPPPPPARTYYEAPPQYYQPAPQPQAYYQPAPVYYQPQPAAVIVESPRPWRGHHHRYYYGY
ncbi:hypothetical protein [Noviherbaspirillum suwonense]|jgi:hypothetical protein|uniref:PXPV repeat-containing protein n=1 Tax=Noviherbaspirillum suwonense TaxID=1224511 RepID=A0ABY1QL50_9BURK|nr:hypothetical protein [Noviherbaspirillum suwonense]SMP74633.1 hypothetical protein SAMN06295970_12144 [Noviherbaspirillum suwonense]